jgi:hypothetical protein
MRDILIIFYVCIALGVAASETVAIGENREVTGEISGAAEFATEGVVTCRVGLFLSRLDAGKRQYHFAHSPETPIHAPAFHGFLQSLGGTPFTALIFLPAQTAAAQGERLSQYFGRLGAHLELLPYEDTEVYEGFEFLARLSGQTLTVQATDGRQTVLRVLKLEQ